MVASDGLLLIHEPPEVLFPSVVAEPTHTNEEPEIAAGSGLIGPEIVV
jgi:hypothetical protein